MEEREKMESIGNVMSDHLNVKIEFSCPDYEERRPAIGIRSNERTV